MSRFMVALLVSLAAHVSAVTMLKRDLSTNLKERPVMKVVRLLQDMKTELEHEMEDDKAVHEQLDCWCKDNDQEKTKAIELGETTESELESFLGEAAAKMKELTAKHGSTLAEVDKDFDALNKAQALRMKENKAFHSEEVDLLEAIKACAHAVVVLKEYNPNPAGFAQVRTAAQGLQQAQVLELVKRSTRAPSSYELAALQSFLSNTQAATSFLSGPGFQSYAPQSGQVFGILEQMKADFEDDLKSSQGKEKQAAEEFAALKAAKDDEITVGRKLVAKFEGEIADLKVKHAEAFKELESTQAQLELDRTFLANLKQKCSEGVDEFETRMKDRQEEIVAVTETIEILNSDTSFDNFDKTVNSAFLQTQIRSRIQETLLQQQRLQDASALLQRVGAELGAPELLLVASRAKLDAFTKVKEEIDKMVIQLTKQQKDEVSHRDFCIDEMNENKLSTAAGQDKQDNLQTKIADTEASIKHLAQEIEANVAAVAEMQKQMKRASEMREAESADYQVTVTDQRMTQIILQKALTRMQETYAFLQHQQPGAPHIQTSGTHTDPGNGPARFTKYEKNSGGSRVVRMLQEVMDDAKKMENDAVAAEQDSQVAYESFMKDSNKAMAAYNGKTRNMRGAVARGKEDLILANTDFKSVMNELEDLNTVLGSLKQSCDFVLQNFDARQEARTKEIEALKQAKAILSGMQ